MKIEEEAFGNRAGFKWMLYNCSKCDRQLCYVMKGVRSLSPQLTDCLKCIKSHRNQHAS